MSKFPPKGPRAPRTEGAYNRPRKPRTEGRSYAPRTEDSYDRPRKPYGEGRSERPYNPRGEGRSYAPRSEGGTYDRPRKPYGECTERPYTPRSPRGEGAERPYTPRGEGRPYTPRTEGSYDRPRKPYGERAERPAPRGFQKSYDAKPTRAPRAEHASWQAEEPTQRPRKNTKQVEFAHPQADGWLIGPHAVLAALQAGRRTLKDLWVAGEVPAPIAKALEIHPEVTITQKDKGAFDSEFGDWVHQGIALQVGNLPQPHLADVLAAKPSLLVALDEVTDPHNIGAILRSCAAFGVGGLIMPERRSGHVTPVVAKAAAGGLELVPVLEVVNLVQTLKQAQEAGYTVVGLAGEGSTTLETYQPSGPTLVVMGSEGHGLRRLTREHCNTLLRISQGQNMESLNVSVAAGITLHALYSQLHNV